ncbi:MAG: hypothetical protein RLZZ174_400 [Pseudomonadota bacterium]
MNGKPVRYVPVPVAGGLCHRTLLNLDRRGQRLTLAWAFSAEGLVAGAPDFGPAMAALESSVQELAKLLVLPMGSRLHVSVLGAAPAVTEAGLWTETELRPQGAQWLFQARLKNPVAAQDAGLEATFLFAPAEAALV